MNQQMYVPPLSRLNKILIGTYVGMFLLTSVLQGTAGINLLAIFGLNPARVLEGHVYQLITYPFFDTALISVIFNALLLWFIGSELEHKWGERFYLRFLVITTYLAGAVFLVLGLVSSEYLPTFHGMTGTNLALLVAYGMVYSERILVFMFIFPMKAKYFCLLLAAIEVFMTLSHRISSLIHCLSMAIAFFFLRYASFVARGGSFQSLRQQKQKDKMRSKLRLVKDEEESEDRPNPDKPKYWQ